jgi:hypothetical protein
VAWLAGQPVAALILLIHGTYANYWRGYSNRDLAGPVSANDLLQKFAIKYTCEAGCLDYNMVRHTLARKIQEQLWGLPLQFPVRTFARMAMTWVERAAANLKKNIKRLSAHHRSPT